MLFSLTENAKPVEALNTASDAAGRTGRWVSLKKYQACYILVSIAQGTAATVTLTVNQATAVAGTGAKALATTVPIWSNLDTATSDALVARTAAVNYTTDAGVKNKIVVIGPIRPTTLDAINGYTSVAVATGASHASTITQATYLLVGPRDGTRTPASAIVD